MKLYFIMSFTDHDKKQNKKTTTTCSFINNTKMVFSSKD